MTVNPAERRGRGVTPCHPIGVNSAAWARVSREGRGEGAGARGGGETRNRQPVFPGNALFPRSLVDLFSRPAAGQRARRPPSLSFCSSLLMKVSAGSYPQISQISQIPRTGRRTLAPICVICVICGSSPPCCVLWCATPGATIRASRAMAMRLAGDGVFVKRLVEKNELPVPGFSCPRFFLRRGFTRSEASRHGRRFPLPPPPGFVPHGGKLVACPRFSRFSPTR